MSQSPVGTPPNPELVALPDLFLLNEKNRVFVEGRSRWIADPLTGADGLRTMARRWGAMVIHPISLLSIFSYVLFIIWLGSSVSGIVNALQFHLFGVTTQGIVLDRQTTGEGKGIEYWITYRFLVPGEDDVTVTGTSEVDEATFIRMEQGGRASVTYVPFNPRIAALTEGKNGDLMSVVCTSVWWGLILLALAHSLWNGLRKLIRSEIPRSRRLARYGRLLKGEVMDSWVTSFKDENNRVLHHHLGLRCGFYDPDGKRYERVEHTRMTYKPFPLLPGTPLAVLYVDYTLYEVL